MDHTENSEQFVQQLTENQNRLYGYVYSLLGDHSRTADVVQETNLVLWRKIDEFDPLRPFLPWAFAIARFQVMAHVRDHKRDRMLLDAELVETLSGEVEKQAENIDQLRRALRKCMQSVTPVNRELIEQKYLRAMSLADVAAATDRTVGAIKVALLRVRRQLSECVKKRIAAEE
ncbi:MAG TPA: RNA polymerase subunit sigma-70 [Planctomycetaceae bacterium]|nr:RNA polymerase subunit sigma-70 [Planctomycetaceae bacterium]